MTEQEIEITFTPIPITGVLGCVVPIKPGTEGDIDAPVEERTELCAIDANWVVGMVPTCDLHVREMCRRLVDGGEASMSWDALVEEAGRDPGKANRPWGERERHTQEETLNHKQHFFRAADLARGTAGKDNGA